MSKSSRKVQCYWRHFRSLVNINFKENQKRDKVGAIAYTTMLDKNINVIVMFKLIIYKLWVADDRSVVCQEFQFHDIMILPIWKSKHMK